MKKKPQKIRKKKSDQLIGTKKKAKKRALQLTDQCKDQFLPGGKVDRKLIVNNTDSVELFIPTKKFTEKESMFIKEFLIDLNATQAAIRAGYSKKTAYSIGSENLTKPEIQAAIKQALKDRAEKIELNAEYVIDHLMELVARCMQKTPVMDFDYKKKELVQRVDDNGDGVWQFDSSGANKALRNLGEHLGLFKKIIAGDKDLPLFGPIQIIKAKSKNKD